MKFIFLTNKIMGKKSGIMTAVAAAAVLTTSPASAETNNQVETQKIEKKIQNVTCSTKLACEKLSLSIQAQIDEFEKKGLENLTEKEFNKYDALSDELITVAKSETKIAKSETLEMKEAQNIKIAELRGVLLSN